MKGKIKNFEVRVSHTKSQTERQTDEPNEVVSK
jgi:hypothetical protein